MTVDVAWAIDWARATAERVIAQRAELNSLDRQIGDGDHGENLSRGFTAVVVRLDALEGLEDNLSNQTPPLSTPSLPLEKLAGYYAHLADLARGYEKDPLKLEENLRHIQAWQADVEELEKLLYKE